MRSRFTLGGFCGQAPSNDPAYARLLVEAGIDSVSVTADSFVAVKTQIAAAEAELGEHGRPRPAGQAWVISAGLRRTASTTRKAPKSTRPRASTASIGGP